MESKKLETAGIQALQLLRKTNLEEGHPFMINSDTLPPDQCYLEFPDGTIQLVALSRTKNDFEEVRKLSLQEQAILRETLQLF